MKHFLLLTALLVIVFAMTSYTTPNPPIKMKLSNEITLTILYDNYKYDEGYKNNWGFSCLIEVEGTAPILFDTGASSSVLLHNMEKLSINPESIGCLFISHDHWDHTGGIKGFTKHNMNTTLYVPESFPSFSKPKVKEIVKVKDARKIHDNVFSTGEIKGIEQSLVVKTDRGLAVIAGCSHPGVRDIMQAASKFGEVIALIGGLHGFREFDLVEDLNLICATHCTQHKEEIRELYPEKFISGGSGKEITV